MGEREYRTGDVIDVTNAGIQVLRTHEDPALGLVIVGVKRMKDGSLREGSVFVDAPGTAVQVVERAGPEGWPPVHKDLWRDRTKELWFTVDVSDPNVTDEPELKFVPSYEADSHEPDEILECWGPLTLIYRDRGAA